MKDLNHIISSYKQRFISTNTRSRNFFLTSIAPKHTLDLVKFYLLFGSDQHLSKLLTLQEEIVFTKLKIDFLEAKEALISNDFSIASKVIPTLSKKDFERIEDLLAGVKEKEKELSLYQSEETDFETSSLYLQLQKEYDKLLKNLDYEIRSVIEQNLKLLNKEFLAIEKLLKTNTEVLKNYGKNDLYVGFPFIEGRFSSDKPFRAPLVLHRVSIDSKAAKITLSIQKGESIFNPVFLVAYHIENELEHKKFNWSLTTDDFIQEAKEILTSHGVSFKEAAEGLEIFASMTKKDYRAQQTQGFNEFSIVKNSVLGLFPISDRNIYNDLEALEDFNFVEEDTVSKLIYSNEATLDILRDKDERRSLEQELKYITDLDYSQKNVVREALEKNLVIEGPPGTGKSQVLSNIVANFVSEGKRVLVVSEKVAAIEVVHNRLGKIGTHALLIRNHIQDKNSFYKQLKEVIAALKNGQFTDGLPSFEELDQMIESGFRTIEKRQDLYHFAEDGFTLKELIQLNETSSKFDLNSFGIFKEHYNMPLKEALESSSEDIHQLFDTGLMSFIADYYHNLPHQVLGSPSLTTKALRYLSDVNAESRHQEEVIYLSHQENWSLHFTPQVVKKPSRLKRSIDALKAEIESHRETKFLNAYKMHREESEKEIYQRVGLNQKGLSLLKIWSRISKKQRVLNLKALHDETFKKPFVMFNACKLLSSDESELYTFIENNIHDLHPEVVITQPLADETVKLLNLMLENKEASIDDLAFMALSYGIFSVDLKEHQPLFEALYDVKRSKVKSQTIQQEIIDVELTHLGVKLFEENILDRQEAIKVLGRVITSELYDKVKADLEFFKTYETQYRSMNLALEQKIDKSRASIQRELFNRIRLKNTDQHFVSALGELQRISGLKRMRSIPEVTKKFTEAILTLFPICLMTPASVSATLENKKGLFDVVVFDEASQMFIEHAVPSIHRSNQVIVAGDSKQLRPSSIFQSRYTEEEGSDDEMIDFGTLGALENESLLDHCRTKFKSVDLRYHYRSEHKELIDFSNHAFYESRLVFSSHVKNHDKLPIELIDVEGHWSDNKNLVEAQKVADLVKHILSTRKHNETIGVITFNSKQMDLVQDLLDEYALEDDKILKEMNRENKKTGSDESLFVKNIENVQGDERDIIIFTVAYAHNERGQLINQFGSLSQPTGENRLNVAITRAKKKIYLIKSIRADDLKPNEENRGNFFFKKYLQYVEKLNANDPIESFLYQLSDTANQSHELDAFDSPFELEVFNALIDKLDTSRFELRNQIRVGSFRIDLAIYDKLKEEYVLGIECDGAMYHSSAPAVEHDFYRQKYLESRGWNIHRIWSTNWWTDNNSEIERITTQLDQFVKKQKSSKSRSH